MEKEIIKKIIIVIGFISLVWLALGV